MINKYRPKKKYKKKKKPILKTRLFWDFVLCVILIASISYFLFFSQIFKIEQIKINSSQEFLQKELQLLLKQKQGSNFFLLSAKNIKQEILEQYPEIESVIVRKIFPKGLILEIKKRKPVGVFCFSQEDQKDIEEKNCSLIDKNSALFNGLASESLPLILGQTKPSKEIISEILKIQKQLQDKFKINTEEFILSDNQRLDVKTSENWEVYFDLTTDISLSLVQLNLLLEKEISLEQRKNLKYIDLRFSRAYYK